LRATKILLDILKDIEKRAGTAPMTKPAPFTAADEEVIEKTCGQAAARLGAGSHHIGTESTGWLIEANSITENEAFLQIA
jgi:hypothetical protein